MGDEYTMKPGKPQIRANESDKLAPITRSTSRPPERRTAPQTSPRSWETPPSPPPAPDLDDYQPIVGTAEIDELRFLARELKGKTIRMVNSTAVGGGVAEMLNRLVPLLGELEVTTRWDVITGGNDFSR